MTEEQGVQVLKWRMDEALGMVRDLNGEMRNLKWFVALAGGVLNFGHSDHDLDLVLVPYDQTNFDFRTATEHFRARGWEVLRTPEDMITSWRRQGLKDTKTVIRWKVDGKIVDTIFPCGRASIYEIKKEGNTCSPTWYSDMKCVECGKVAEFRFPDFNGWHGLCRDHQGLWSGAQPLPQPPEE